MPETKEPKPETKDYSIVEYSNLVQRRNYGKIKRMFDFPNYADIQSKSYDKFINTELEGLIKGFFPIVSTNGKYQLEFNGLKITEPLCSEQEAELRSLSYACNVYIDVQLKDNETGQIYKSKKQKTKKAKGKNDKQVPDGIFLTWLPKMTKRGTFLINGTEKFIISQIVRSPGSYILHKAQLKLSNSRRRILEGLICEVLPIKGTMFSIYVQKDEPKDKHNKPNKYIQIMLRDVLGNQSMVAPITQFLKALGYTKKIIDEIYDDEELIANSYKNEKYNEKEIFDFPQINDMLNDLKKIKTKAEIRKKILTPDYKIRVALFDYKAITDQIDELESKLVDEQAKKDGASKAEIARLQEQIDKLKVEQQKYLDIIIVEHAACSFVEGLNISQKTLDNLAERISDQDEFCFQTIIWYHFFNTNTFNMSLAGRYKINQKMEVNERLFDQVLSRPIVDKNGHTLVNADGKLFKKEVDIIIDAIKDERIAVKSTYDPIFIPGSKAKTKSGIVVDNTVNSIYVHAPKTSSEQKELRIIGTTVKPDVINLTMSDIISFISYVINLNYGVGQYDEVDHLGNKRLKLVGELLHGKMNVGMIRVDKFIREKLAIASSSASLPPENQLPKDGAAANTNAVSNAQNNFDDIEATDFVATKKGRTITVKSIINTKPLQQIVREFFNSYQLTQFIDQQNPLSELTNKRRISAMGPGGISREDPNLGIRDINSSYYGRICPIETPEGMNIGLIMSLASYVRVDQNGFLITPYFVIENGSLVYEMKNGMREAKVEWLDALKETEHIIANASTPMDDKGHILTENVMCRFKAEQKQYPRDMVEYIDVNPNQVVSVAASSIPFLENDDANRALMGANMQRQATPLLYPHAPSVGTGNEYKIAYDSSFAIIADEDGTISEVDGSHIVLTSEDSKRKYDYKLMKYHRSNQNTCFNQTAIVSLNQKVKKGEIIANGPAMQNGELALGQNALVAFSSFDGYNFEDAIVISERVVNEDLFTSIHIEEKIINCLRTKNGDEEITRDIPNVSEDAKRYLDENGIVIVGADVQEGDILVGKVTPKGRVELTVEEKLLQSIFGEKVKNVRDSSLKVPYGGEGVVIAVHHFTANDGSFGDDVLEVVKILIAKKSKIQVGDKMSGRHGNKGIVSRIVKIEDMPHLADGTPIDIMLTPEGVPSRMNMGQVMELHTGISARKIGQKLIISTAFKEVPCEEKAKEIQQILGIPYYKAFNLMNQATLYFPTRFKDKKTALSKYTIDDLLIVFNHAGVSIDDLDYKVATPVFSGIKMDDLKNIMTEAGFDLKDKGKFTLYDGRTGDPFDAPISVGVMYMLKLDHLVNDKIHARNVGPYSKITQQPLGGKSQNGGQRFGEMEVWALEAYGAAYNLREILTIKSDDVAGRNEAYNAIIKGKEIQNIGLPESFKLLVKQLQGLGVKLEGITKEGKKFDLNNLSVDRNATSEQDNEDKITELEDESANENNYNYETDVTV